MMRLGKVAILLGFWQVWGWCDSGLAKERRLGVLLGDPPVDWAAAHPNLNRPDSFTAELIRREVLSKDRAR